MKKRLFSLLCVLVLLSMAVFGGCGSAKSAQTAVEEPAAAPMPMPMESAVSFAADSAANGFYEAAEMEEAKAETAFGGVAVSGNSDEGNVPASSAGQMNADKIIYSADAQIETFEYEKTVQGVYDLVANAGGFVESSGISGSNYYNYSRGQKTYRTASFTLRIPSAQFKSVTSSLSDLGNVPYCNTYSENVTSQYYDVQSRITSYKTQETRLLEMLEIAESVEDLLAIQAQLAEVQYQIDYYQSRLTNYDRQINYSTLNLTVCEVEEYTAPPKPVEKSYWQKMGDGFKESLKDVGDFFCDLFLWIISNLPALIVWAVVLCLAYLGVRKAARRRKETVCDGLTQKERRQRRRAGRKAGKAGTDASEPAVNEDNIQ